MEGGIYLTTGKNPMQQPDFAQAEGDDSPQGQKMTEHDPTRADFRSGNHCKPGPNQRRLIATPRHRDGKSCRPTHKERLMFHEHEFRAKRKD